MSVSEELLSVVKSESFNTLVPALVPALFFTKLVKDSDPPNNLATIEARTAKANLDVDDLEQYSRRHALRVIEYSCQR